MTGDSIYKIQGDLVFQTVTQIKKEGDAFIRNSEFPSFDFAQVGKTDTSAIVLILAWQREANKLQKSVQFNNIPRQLFDLAETYDVQNLI